MFKLLAKDRTFGHGFVDTEIFIEGIISAKCSQKIVEHMIR